MRCVGSILLSYILGFFPEHMFMVIKIFGLICSYHNYLLAKYYEFKCTYEYKIGIDMLCFALK